MEELTLVWPSRDYLPGYVAALERGWSPDNIRGKAAADEELTRIAADPDAFLASLSDREGAGRFTLPDGTAVPEVLAAAGAEGLRYVEITTDSGNLPSRRVIERNGGILVEEFVAPAAVGGHRELRYRVDLVSSSHP